MKKRSYVDLFRLSQWRFCFLHFLRDLLNGGEWNKVFKLTFLSIWEVIKDEAASFVTNILPSFPEWTAKRRKIFLAFASTTALATLFFYQKKDQTINYNKTNLVTVFALCQKTANFPPGTSGNFLIIYSSLLIHVQDG